jgi:hypothetical protein
VGPVNAYNSDGLWLQPPEVVAAEAIALRDEGRLTALKLRLGRDRASDDPTRSATACFIFLTCLVLVLNGMRMWSERT